MSILELSKSERVEMVADALRELPAQEQSEIIREALEILGEKEFWKKFGERCAVLSSIKVS